MLQILCFAAWAMSCHGYYLSGNKMLAFRHQREGTSFFSPHIFTIILNHNDFFLASLFLLLNPQ
jgi:hypothetical protein